MIFFEKILVILLQLGLFICSYLTAMQYTVGKNSLTGRE